MPLRRLGHQKILKSMRSWTKPLWWCRATKVFLVDGPCIPTLEGNLSDGFLPTPETDCVVVIPDGDVFSQIIGKIAEPTFSIAEIAIVAVTCSHFQIANRSTTNRSDHLQSSLRKKSLADYPGQKSAEEFFLRSKILQKLFWQWWLKKLTCVRSHHKFFSDSL